MNNFSVIDFERAVESTPAPAAPRCGQCDACEDYFADFDGPCIPCTGAPLPGELGTEAMSNDYGAPIAVESTPLAFAQLDMLAAAVAADIAPALRALDSTYGTTSAYCLKTRAAALEKVTRRAKGYTLAHVPDYFRARIVVTGTLSTALAMALVSTVARAADSEIIGCSDYWTTPAPGGFRALNFNLRHASGMLFEIQVTIPEMVEAAKDGHKAYVLARTGRPNPLLNALATAAYIGGYSIYMLRTLKGL